MDVTDLRIVFLGTPDFAVASLAALVEAGFNVVGVVTAPDKHAGRGMKLTESAVKKYAMSKGLHLLQPEKLKNTAFIESLRSLNATLQVVVAFRMLPEMVWNMPPLGTINVHGSLLPQYRGAAPINWAIINGETVTGVTTFKLQHAIDTGDILLQTPIPIDADENVGQLHDRMMGVGAETLVATIQQLLDNSLTPIQQAESEASLRHAPKIFSETCLVNWNSPVQNIYNFVRGLSPYPAAFTILNEKKLKIFQCTKEVVANHTTPIGQFETDHKTFLKCSGLDGYIHIKELQLEGKKRMEVGEFLRGFRL